MSVDVTVNIKLVESGTFHFEEHLAPDETKPSNGANPSKGAKQDQIVPLSSSVVAPGLPRLIAR